MHIKSSVIIPAKNRFSKLERAIASVAALDTTNCVEIIIVDDRSEVPIPRQKSMRPWDTIIHLSESKGAAVARNVGIKAAKGDLIYLLDSDDLFIKRNFEADHQQYNNTENLYYVDIWVDGKLSDYPVQVDRNNFFDFILFKHFAICQTSSLFFCRTTNLLFDESLPKHQDWDFVYDFLCFKKGAAVKAEGEILFSRDDPLSMSRLKKTESLSIPFIKKLQTNSKTKPLEIVLFRYIFLKNSTKHLGWIKWITDSRLLLNTGYISLSEILKSLKRRLTRLLKPQKISSIAKN